MRKLFIVVLLLSVVVLPVSGQKIDFSQKLSPLDWKIEKRAYLLPEDERLAWSFSKANIIEKKNKWSKLDYCNCSEKNDTITIWISYRSEGGIGVSLKVYKDHFTSSFVHYSDIAEFANEQYEVIYRTSKTRLNINYINLQNEKGIVGYIDLKSKPIKTINRKVFEYQGKFQCIIKTV
ncbi:hypothetical protein GXP67_06510 [Rhodocytophaga rosea]|uniref:Uncharacterized protein n=1 Tax=Rhodocytophaga rosea TaxID=2704465 RepID=A0A6C0GEY8_9BACT|nr:hypothetical protein [Rhodocytophaga rosea]QHT66333.1 hypothetical protein GXP67_06510 [Rhodocytophaga rosea]